MRFYRYIKINVEKSNTLRMNYRNRTYEPLLPSVDLNHLQMHPKEGRTFAAPEHLWSLVVLTKGLRKKTLISNSFKYKTNPLY